MDTGGYGTILAGVLARYRTGQISRRTLGRLLGALGVAGTSGAALSSHPAGASALRQEGTPAAGGEPPVAATPALGEQPDGTRVWRVQVGAVDKAEMVEAMGFFPEEITVNTGDAVFFDFGPRFHTATFLSGQERPLLIVPDEAAGTPAAGGDRFIINPAAGFPAGGGTYDGTGYVNSGLPDPSAPPFMLTFTTPGTYDYLCLVHPQMKARVVVQEAGAKPPTDQAAYDRLGTEQAEALLEEGRALIRQQGSATPEAGTDGVLHEVVAGVGGDNVEVLRFLPRDVVVKVGDTVRWTNPSMHEPHTVTFLGEEDPPELILVEPQEGGPPTLVFNPVLLFPAGEDTFDGARLANSGTLGQELAEISEEFPRTSTYELTFTAPGEYRYYCAFHSGGPDDEHAMVGTVRVS
jgi:plastocyanin